MSVNDGGRNVSGRFLLREDVVTTRLERKTKHGSRPACFLFQANASIFHLSSVAFETDTAGGGKFQSCLEQLTVANTVRDTILHGDFNFIPILWSVLNGG